MVAGPVDEEEEEEAGAAEEVASLAKAVAERVSGK